MVTVHREAGLRFVIFSDDHEPAHVHVIGDGVAKVNLVAEDEALELVWAKGMSRATFARRCGLVVSNRIDF